MVKSMNTRKVQTALRTVGIMTCPAAGEVPVPEKFFFRKLTLIGKELGLTVFVFFPNRIDWQRRRVVGYAYSAESGRWEKGVFPFPDAVYDRCFYSNRSTYAAYREPIRRLMSTPGIHFLGYGLKGKWNVHQMLMRDERIEPFLPETERLQDTNDIARWLDGKGELFLKPQGGSHGKGVLRIQKIPNGFGVTGRTSRNEPVCYDFRSSRRMLDWVRQFTDGRPYLIQRYLHLNTASGDAFDIRALMQKNRKGLWELTGLAVRQGAPGSVTSNLHGGGHAEEAKPYLGRLYGDAAGDILETVKTLAQRVPEVLEQHHGRLVELGVDIGVDTDGSVWLLEANSKPGRSAFAALPGKQASLAAVRNPMLYAKYVLDTRKGVPARQSASL
ncbi:YheC/YheD family protein [Paenibacillus ginsengarvi]|uniref:YheC/YheD family protein n=2 Tax=Paenibacillus ginsengarvi TaxID=400777 RepID=A0A3B0CJE6_9BACL|nr:YheC/YheD family protein [Paenibacillus ginsengarvi]